MKLTRLLWCLVLAAVVPTLMFGDTFSGNFKMDEDVVLISLSIPSPSTVTIQTTSFAAGGFEPVLTLYDGAGNLLLQDSTGGTVPAGCGARAIDSTSGYCLDAFLQALLNAGNYTLALTEWDNIPGGPTLADGFPQTGNGNFTGPEFIGQSGSFLLFDGSQRGTNWALQVDGATATTPEPASVVLLLSGVVMSRRLLRRKGSRQK